MTTVYIDKNTLIIRLPLIFGPTHKKQIVSKMLSNLKLNKKIRVAKDVYYTPSFSPYIAEFLFYVINENYSRVPQGCDCEYNFCGRYPKMSLLIDVILVLLRQIKNQFKSLKK